jgi:glycosyltransferase involved in cell wall biosynthesis
MAYGVTTELTAEAAVKLGYDSLVVTPNRDLSLGSALPIRIIGNRIYKLILNKRLKMFIFARFALFMPIFSYMIVNEFKNSKYIYYWTRDALVAYCLSKLSTNKIILEIHRSPKKFDSVILIKLKKNKKIVFAPISQSLELKLGLRKDSSIVAPMSVRQSELDSTRASTPLRKKSIVYLGGFKSGSHNLNVDLINQIGRKLYQTNPDWNIQIIGVDEEVFQLNCKNQVSANINFLGRIARNDVMKILRTSSIGLLIYPNYEYFIDSFPIKSVEYASAKLAIIASDTLAHRRILGPDKCIYFKVDSEIDLFNSINKLISNQTLLESLSTKAFNWAETLTYEKRLQGVLDKLEIS